MKLIQKVRTLKSPDAASTFCNFVVPGSRRAHDDDRAEDRLLRDLRMAVEVALHAEAIDQEAQEPLLEGSCAFGVELCSLLVQALGAAR